MAKKTNTLTILIIIILSILGYFNQDVIVEKADEVRQEIKLGSSSNISIEEKEVILNLEENITRDLEVKFCPSNECYELLNLSFEEAKYEIKCAFYEFDEDNLSEILKEKSKSVNISLVIDDRYLDEIPLLNLANTSVKIYSDEKRGTRFNNYMHDKFCVIDDEILITGSTNPTNNGLYKNNNNLVKLHSKYLSKNYENEFDQMTNLVFGEKKKSYLEYNNVTLNFENESYLISSYMCPQDNCDEVVIKYLNESSQEILFANFAITHDEISDKLIEKYNLGIEVKGLIEKRNRNLKGSDYSKLNATFEFSLDTNKNNMHHKFFVIDRKIVITGSMNPSGSGANYNDENILVIENEEIANLFVGEFEKLTQ